MFGIIHTLILRPVFLLIKWWIGDYEIEVMMPLLPNDEGLTEVCVADRNSFRHLRTIDVYNCLLNRMLVNVNCSDAAIWEFLCNHHGNDTRTSANVETGKWGGRVGG